MKKIRTWFKNIFKTEPELIEQIIYEVFYSGMCPICKKTFEGGCEEYRYSQPPFTDKSLIECPDCHIAIYGKLARIAKILKKYREHDNELPELISEETIC